ncbi:MAG: ChbG/HpnK family deacetylase [Gemmatimonadetes bacterium]|nr:ChbG/HpnK family deacetylase [Gemmatimonadota bacterium]
MGATTSRRLVVNADDLGFTPGVNRGIFECAAAGTVTSASVMVNTPGFDDAMAGRGSVALGLGLHLNLIDGRPLTPAPSLVNPDTGDCWPFATFLARATAGALKRAELEAEVTAQLGRLAAAGVAITHVDSHRHTHVHPAVWPAVVAAARAAGVRVIRIPREPLGHNAGRARATLSKVLLGVAMRGGASYAAAKREGFHTADHFRGISSQGAADVAADVRAVVRDLAPGLTELMVHPGYVDDALRARDGYLAPREAEVQALTEPALVRDLRASGVALVSFAAA